MRREVEVSGNGCRGVGRLMYEDDVGWTSPAAELRGTGRKEGGRNGEGGRGNGTGGDGGWEETEDGRK